MKRTLSRGGWILLASLAIGLAGCATPIFTTTLSLPSRVPRAPEVTARLAQLTPREQMNLRVFEAAWQRVDHWFYDAKFHGVDWPGSALAYGPSAVQAKNDEELYGTLNKMLAELKDAHTYANSAKDLVEISDPPQPRLGISFARIGEEWIVFDVLPESPAAEAGVKRGWIYLGREGELVGKEIDLQLHEGHTAIYDFRDGKDVTRHVSIKARFLRMGKWLKTEELADGVIYLRFDGFDRESRRWLSDQLKAHRDAPAVIVDLRNNLGGSAFSLEITLGEFFPRHMSWGQFSKRGDDWTDVDTWQWGSARYPGKVAVLVSAVTASSGEILAHALQYHRRAVLVGRKTSGRVIGAATFKLPDGGRVQVGTWDYHSLDGKQIDGVGVAPDVAVENQFGSYEDLRAGLDADIVAALAALTTPPPANASRATSTAGDGRVQ